MVRAMLLILCLTYAQSMESDGSYNALMTKDTLYSHGCTNISDLSRCHFDKGLVFIKQRDILLMTGTWTIAVTVGTKNYDDILV